ncbi:MAG: ATP-binding domain-containing protein [Rubrivivax sp.]|nr:ATP-binding domain-containing protein [Rubrivivax sp.]
MASDHRNLAVICKTPKQAARWHKALQGKGVDARLLDGGSEGWGSGVLVCTPHLAKGLEFDRVIVADASAENYAAETDRKLLYVACTRAMHRLTVLAVGALTPLIPVSAASAAMHAQA